MTGPKDVQPIRLNIFEMQGKPWKSQGYTLGITYVCRDHQPDNRLDASKRWRDAVEGLGEVEINTFNELVSQARDATGKVIADHGKTGCGKEFTGFVTVEGEDKTRFEFPWSSRLGLLPNKPLV